MPTGHIPDVEGDCSTIGMEGDGMHFHTGEKMKDRNRYAEQRQRRVGERENRKYGESVCI